MRKIRRRTISALLLIALLLVGCGGQTEAAETEAAADGPVYLSNYLSRGLDMTREDKAYLSAMEELTKEVWLTVEGINVSLFMKNDTDYDLEIRFYLEVIDDQNTVTDVYMFQMGEVDRGETARDNTSVIDARSVLKDAVIYSESLYHGHYFITEPIPLSGLKNPEICGGVRITYPGTLPETVPGQSIVWDEPAVYEILSVEGDDSELYVFLRKESGEANEWDMISYRITDGNGVVVDSGSIAFIMSPGDTARATAYLNMPNGDYFLEFTTG